MSSTSNREVGPAIAASLMVAGLSFVAGNWIKANMDPPVWFVPLLWGATALVLWRNLQEARGKKKPVPMIYLIGLFLAAWYGYQIVEGAPMISVKG